MKKILLAALIAATPLFAGASDVRVDVGSLRVQTGGVTVTFGSRNDRGYYWDGQEWREPVYWKKHHGPRGEKYYTGRPQGVPHQGPGFCPPGQAKKGNC
ncbi:hypothetical protein BJN45_08500 [Azonexus hydrophilus]|uniref:DUF2502 domain-containing protein n=1 Tax=Azonexus hydrophilus TaxID=418702 RepID=A0A1R1I976_9RHOO|nr:DUF2502 domain-containing protein [Azonexus hydrophilus]OMG55170.1 hypothetical protein BJN45_08500 [Azonexus hydrophilus]